MRQRDAEYADYYDRKFHDVHTHSHLVVCPAGNRRASGKRAVVLTARKRVRLVVRLLTTRQPYRPRRT